MTWIQFVSYVAIPAFVGLAVWIAGCHRAAHKGLREGRDELAAFKISVAETYATKSHVVAVEKSIMHKLERIEDKLDIIVGLKTK